MKLRTYCHALINTFSSALYYVDILNTKFSFSIRFFLISYFLLGIIGAKFFWSRVVPWLRNEIATSLEDFQQHFPPYLQVTWDGEQLQTVPTAPLTIPYPQFVPSDGLPSELAIINVLASAPPSSTPALLFVTKNTLFGFQGDNQWTELPLKDIPQLNQAFTITTETLPAFIDQAKHFSEQLLRFAAFAYPIAFVSVVAPLRLLSLLFESILLFFVLRLVNPFWTFRKIYQLSLHIAVVAETIQLVTTFFFHATALPMFTLAFWGYFMIILWQLRSVKLLPLRHVQRKKE